MATKKNAMKAKRSADKRYIHNRAIKKKIRDLRKAANKALEAKNADQAMTLYRQLQQVVDKASKTHGFLSRNTAARYKSRLASNIRAASGKK